MSGDERVIRSYRELAPKERAEAARTFAETLRMIPFDGLAGVSDAHLAMAFEVLDDLPTDEAPS